MEGLPPRAAVDIYALATVLYELLAGFTPFGGGHPGAVLRRHVTETVVPLPGIPDELWQLIVQCLAKAPASRLRASELSVRLRDLLPLLAGMPPLDVDEPDEPEPEPESAEPVEGDGPVRRRGWSRWCRAPRRTRTGTRTPRCGCRDRTSWPGARWARPGSPALRAATGRARPATARRRPASAAWP